MVDPRPNNQAARERGLLAAREVVGALGLLLPQLHIKEDRHLRHAGLLVPTMYDACSAVFALIWMPGETQILTIERSLLEAFCLNGQSCAAASALSMTARSSAVNCSCPRLYVSLLIVPLKRNGSL